MITYTVESHGCYEISNTDDDETILVQSDWDYPSLAHTFGWTGICECGETDGTVNCSHKSASDMIDGAREYLDTYEGEMVEDPCYFTRTNLWSVGRRG